MIYTFGIYVYCLGVSIAALFNRKVRLLWLGHRRIFATLREHCDPSAQYIWFHAASLGEFEQGRPLMERLRHHHPEYKILLTFFSPSGYEVRKDWPGADVVCYMPFDTPRAARRFVRAVHIRKAIFIKYEFWLNFLARLKREGIATYSVSSIFRPEQFFFHRYGRPYAQALRCFEHLFVQNERSRQLLAGIGIDRVTVVGDTRFDRVLDIRRAAKPSPAAAAFAAGRRVMVAGSTWPADEDLLLPYFNSHPELFLILAPHVVSPEHLADIERKLQRPAVRLSALSDPADAAKAHCLIIDGYGLLSSLYRYGCMAYVGGGFGAGVHNVPEAAVYGVPVMIGPNNHKFREVQALLQAGGCKQVSDAAELARTADLWLTNDEARATAGRAAGEYIASHSGATEATFNAIAW